MLTKQRGESRGEGLSSRSWPRQRRGHAVRLASEGANTAAIDISRPDATAGYPLASPDDPARSVVGCRRCRSRHRRVAEFGTIDVVRANAAIASSRRAHELGELGPDARCHGAVLASKTTEWPRGPTPGQSSASHPSGKSGIHPSGSSAEYRRSAAETILGSCLVGNSPSDGV